MTFQPCSITRSPGPPPPVGRGLRDLLGALPPSSYFRMRERTTALAFRALSMTFQPGSITRSHTSCDAPRSLAEADSLSSFSSMNLSRVLPRSRSLEPPRRFAWPRESLRRRRCRSRDALRERESYLLLRPMRLGGQCQKAQQGQRKGKTNACGL